MREDEIGCVLLCSRKHIKNIRESRVRGLGVPGVKTGCVPK